MNPSTTHLRPANPPSSPRAAAHRAFAGVLLGALLTVGPAMAQNPAPAPGERQEARVDNRQERQDSRIEQGVATGEITRREQARLNHQQNRVGRLENRVESDGQVTRKEAYRVEKAQDRSSRRIAHAKSDRQSRPAGN